MNKHLSIAIVLASHLSLGGLLLAAPASAGSEPMESRAVVSSELNYVTLTVESGGAASISFQGFGHQYVLPAAFFGQGSAAVIAATGMVRLFASSHYISFASQATSRRNRVGLPIFIVKQIRFAYTGPIQP